MNNLKNGNNYDAYEMIRAIAEDENLKRFLEKHRIAKISEINFKKYFNKNDNRCTAIIDAYEESLFNHSSKIFIDLRIGQPSVYQVYDALYELGEDCDIKIIIYTNGHNDYDKGIPVADEYVVAGLIGELQYNNIPIVLFSIDKNTLTETYVDMYQNWYDVNRLRSYIIPSKESFTDYTFWCVYFDSFSENFYEPWNAYEGLLSGDSRGNYVIYIDSVFRSEIQLLWDDKGAGFEIEQTRKNDEFLKQILDLKMSSFKKHYGEDSVQFENAVRRLPRLYINYSDKPFDWLLSATPDKITAFAGEMYDDAWNLRWLIEGAAEELYQVDNAQT